jgi:polyisoprenoid-binding protein YceI
VKPTGTEWEVDNAHTAVRFSVKHMMLSTVRGQFRKLTGTVVLDEADVSRSRVEVEIDAASLDTGEPQRDAHLRSSDFLNVEKFPKLSFRSTSIERAGQGFMLTGDLTVNGVTRPLTLAVASLTKAMKDTHGRTIRGASATGKVNRKHWGLRWSAALETGGVLVGEEVKLQIDAELVAKTLAPHEP